MIRVLIGLVVGIVISLLLFDYNGSQYQLKGVGESEYRQVSEFDFNFLFHSLITTSLCIAGTFLISKVFQRRS
ncbi:xanthine/uracil permease [Jeotgalibacillus terrae]|nr:xanthine/uracil permease [Jeotgalibacillus terrae]